MEMKWWLLPAVMLLINVSNLQARKLRVLFIGNSYTYTNNLPLVLAQIAASQGDTLLSDASVVGGYTFKNHFENATTRTKIAAGNWDFVVLQAQSQEPSFPDEQVAAETFPYAKKLDSLIDAANPCTETAFFLTWGRKNGDAGNCSIYPPICTYSGMQDKLTVRYLQMATFCDGITIPVGEAWRKMRLQYPSVELYNPDESHPAVNGTYLAGLVFYHSLFRKVPLPGVYRPASIPDSLAENIRMVTVPIVSDSTTKWFGNGKNVQAGISHSYTGNPFEVKFKLAGWGSGDMHWDFGDGSQSSEQEPVHTFAGLGIYTIRQKISNACYADSVQGQILVQFTDVQAGISEASPDFFPNPVDRNDVILQFRSRPENVQLINMQGIRMSLKTENEFLQLPENLPSGVYQIHYKMIGETAKRKKLLLIR